MTNGRIAISSPFRYEPDWLVQDWLEHVSWADAVIPIDTRSHPVPWIPRVERVEWMMQAAEQAHCDWLFILDIDERLSLNAEPILRSKVEQWEPWTPFAFKFACWEMFTPTERRIDGVWGRKTRRRFFHVASRRADMIMPCTKMREPVIAHTHHLDPANDAARVAKHNAFNTWDRAGRAGTGYDYLNDRRGMVLREVPEGTFPPLKPWRFEMT